MKNELGYDKKCIDEITSQVFLMQISSVALIGKGVANFSRLGVFSLLDENLCFDGHDELYPSTMDSNYTVLQAMCTRADMYKDTALVHNGPHQSYLITKHDLSGMHRFSREGRFYESGDGAKPINLVSDRLIMGLIFSPLPALANTDSLSRRFYRMR